MRSALIVIDVQQEYFVGGLPIVYPDRHDVLDRIVQTMRSATAAGVPVVVVQHTEPDPESAVFRAGSPMVDLHPAIAIEHRDHLVHKAYPGTFTGTDFGSWIGDHGVNDLVICGFMTHMCCDTTARQAVHLDLTATVLADAAGTIDLEDADGATVPARQVHETELAVLASGFARIVTAQTWLDELPVAP